MLIHSGHSTHEVLTCQPYIRSRSGQVHQPKTDVLTTKPRRHPYSKSSPHDTWGKVRSFNWWQNDAAMLKVSLIWTKSELKAKIWKSVCQCCSQTAYFELCIIPYTTVCRHTQGTTLHFCYKVYLQHGGDYFRQSWRYCHSTRFPNLFMYVNNRYRC